MRRRLPAEKVCDRCGERSFVRPNVRRCRRPRFGKGSCACWGHLRRPERKRTEPKPKLSRKQRAERELLSAERLFKNASDKMVELAQELTRVTLLYNKRQRAVAIWRERASWTDEQFEADRAARRARVASRRVRTRGMDLKEVV